MSRKKFLVPMGMAISALFASTADAATALAPGDDSKPMAEKSQSLPRSEQASDPIVREVTYQIGADQHLLYLRRAPHGAIYMAHSSHASHGSHGSHRSHRSGS